MRRRLVTTITLCGLAACTSATIPGGYRTDPLLEQTGPASSLITAAELRSANVPDLFSAVSRLRPGFLIRMRDVHSSLANRSSLDVYLDNAYLGDVTMLRTVSAESVTSVRYLSASEATIRWGDKHRGDVLLLSTH